MIPKVTEMIEMIKQVEKAVHKGGWDNENPTLYTVNASDDRTEMMVVTAPYQPLEHEETAEAGLRRLADFWEGGHMDGVLRTMPDSVKDAAVAMMFVAESWISPLTYEQRGNRLAADHPDSQEARLVLALDAGGRMYYYQRIRGEHPTMEYYEKPDEDRTVAGPLVASLAATLYGMIKTAPIGSADRDAVRAWADAPVGPR